MSEYLHVFYCVYDNMNTARTSQRERGRGSDICVCLCVCDALHQWVAFFLLYCECVLLGVGERECQCLLLCVLAPTEYGCYSLPVRESVGGREWECVGVCRCLSATVAAMVCVCSCLCVSPSVRVCYGVRVRVCSCLSRCSCVCWLLLSMCAKVGCPAMCVCATMSV